MKGMNEFFSELLDRCDIGMEQQAKIAAQAREVAYTGIGLGILGFQRAQVLRREYQPAVEQFIADLRAHRE
jgi:hypothetical protein